MTERKDGVDLVRKNWMTGRLLRRFLRCPLCAGRTRVQSYRVNVVRMRCTTCNLGFTVDPKPVIEMVERRAVERGLIPPRS
jgi:transposase-like protein